MQKSSDFNGFEKCRGSELLLYITSLCARKDRGHSIYSRYATRMNWASDTLDFIESTSNPTLHGQPRSSSSFILWIDASANVCVHNFWGSESCPRVCAYCIRVAVGASWTNRAKFEKKINDYFVFNRHVLGYVLQRVDTHLLNRLNEFSVSIFLVLFCVVFFLLLRPELLLHNSKLFIKSLILLRTRALSRALYTHHTHSNEHSGAMFFSWFGGGDIGLSGSIENSRERESERKASVYLILNLWICFQNVRTKNRGEDVGPVRIYLQIEKLLIGTSAPPPSQLSACVYVWPNCLLNHSIFHFSIHSSIVYTIQTQFECASRASTERLPHIPSSSVCILRSTADQISMRSFFQCSHSQH